MSKYVVRGGRQAAGTVSVEGSKNAVLPILAACILVEGVSVLDNVPRIKDVYVTLDIMRNLGCCIRIKECNNVMRIIVDATNIVNSFIPEKLAGSLRSSVIFMGALLGRLGEVQGCMPGGCRLGERPIDMHLKAFEEMGCELEQVTEWDIKICKCECGKVDGRGIYGEKNIVLPFPSVGATENVILAAIGLGGRTIIKNCAREPEIVDLQDFLNKAGFTVSGAGSSVIVVESCRGRCCQNKVVCHRIMPDRIVAATYMCVAAVTGGCVTVNNVVPGHVRHMIDFLCECGCRVNVFKNSIVVCAPQQLSALRGTMETEPYPGFPTDMQPLATVVMTLSDGCSVMRENIFSNRFSYVKQLNMFGADVVVNNNTAVVRGVSNLNACTCCAEDLRGGAALVLAALAVRTAREESVIDGIEFVNRGYERFDEKLRGLGLDVQSR